MPITPPPRAVRARGPPFCGNLPVRAILVDTGPFRSSDRLPPPARWRTPTPVSLTSNPLGDRRRVRSVGIRLVPIPTFFV